MVGKRNPVERKGKFGGFECSIDEAKEMYSFSGRVYEKLEELGISPYDRPVLAREHMAIFPDAKAGEFFDGRMPTVIRSLDIDKLSILHSLFARWHAYVRTQTLYIAAQRSEAQQKKESVWSMVREIHKYEVEEDGKRRKRSDQQRSDKARMDYRYVEVDAFFEEVNALYNYMGAVVEVVKADMKIISREITVHQVAAEEESNRQSNVKRIAEASGPAIPRISGWAEPGDNPEVPSDRRKDAPIEHKKTPRSRPARKGIPRKSGGRTLGPGKKP